MYKLANKSCQFSTGLFAKIKSEICTIQSCGLKHYPPIEPVDMTDWPEYRKLRVMNKQPDFGSIRAPRMPKMIKLMRGPEPVHTDFIYKGYGVVALLGGRLKFEHFEFIRNSVNRKLDTTRMFALWRVDSPWQPCSKKGVGKKLGGGKGPIHHYVTPVKAHRVIIELGGSVNEIEARGILNPVANSMPFPARVYSQKELDEERKENEWVQKNNINPFTIEYVFRNNMGGCKSWISKYDLDWFARYK